MQEDVLDEENKIDDQEVILRRISGGKSPKQRHFKLRKDINEEGVSCNRKTLMSPEELKAKGTRADDKVAEALVEEIRKLGLKVVAITDENDKDNAGHCEIQSDTASLDDEETRTALAKLFKVVPEAGGNAEQ